MLEKRLINSVMLTMSTKMQLILLLGFSLQMMGTTSAFPGFCKTAQKNDGLLNRAKESYTLWCVAQCLNLLDRGGSKPKDACNYDVNTGNAYEYFTRNCSGCMQLYPTSPMAIEAKRTYNTFPPIKKKLCGKQFIIGNSPVSHLHEFMYYVCTVVDKSLKVWTPKDANEIKCVIENMPADHQKQGKLGIHVFKSSCLQKLMNCDLQFPRLLGANFLPFVPAPANVSLGTYNGTCAIIKFAYKNKIATNLELVETSCTEKSAPFFCEVRGNY